MKIILIAYLVMLTVEYLMVRFAPLGWQDKNGFHYEIHCCRNP